MTQKPQLCMLEDISDHLYMIEQYIKNVIHMVSEHYIKEYLQHLSMNSTWDIQQSMNMFSWNHLYETSHQL